MDDEVLRYLLSLLQYPEVDIRLQSVEALVALLAARPDMISRIQGQWLDFTDAGTREYIVSVFHSLGATRPDLTEKWATWLVQATESEGHFNIKVSVAEAVCGGRNTYLACERAKRALDISPVLRPLAPQLTGLEQARIAFPNYPSWLVEVFSDGASGEQIFDSEVSRLLHERYPDARDGLENDSVIHRQHNINTNFDNLEISPPFAEACREAVNRSIVNLINAHEYDYAYAHRYADVLRLRDPSDSLVCIVPKPQRVEWLSFADSQDDFLAFRDSDEAIAGALQSQNGFTKLFEYSEQRGTGGDRDRSARVCIARIELFGVRQSGKVPAVTGLTPESIRLKNSFRNRYRSEIERLTLGAVGPFIPLVAVTRRCFRGRWTGELAGLSSCWNDEIPNASFQDQFDDKSLDVPMLGRVIEWRSAFDQDRRLHEPKSSGSLLEVDTALLKKFATRYSLELYAKVTLQRTTDQYKPEYMMTWREYSQVVRVPGV